MSAQGIIKNGMKMILQLVENFEVRLIIFLIHMKTEKAALNPDS